MTIDPGGREYLYMQLAGLLREKIASGEYAPGSRIPSITALAAEHGLSVITCRAAVGVLKAEGLTLAMPGRGTFVAER
jgi:DNA-binding GntR family transcriptional regulator